MQGGTFTLTNHGTGGSLFAMPILVQPQAGILGVGAIQKRAVVVSRGHPLLPDPDDAIAIRPMAYLSFTFDHRVLDGAGADRFLAAVKRFLEEYSGLIGIIAQNAGKMEIGSSVNAVCQILQHLLIVIVRDI